MWCSAVGFIVTLTLSLLVAPLTVTAQPRRTVPRIGILIPGTASNPLWEAFQQALRDLGYEEGKHIVLEYRFAEGQYERLPALAAELVRLPVDVLVTAGPGTLAAKQATATIPIVFTVFADPVAEGLVASLARPGGNVTGLSMMSQDLAAMLAVLRQMAHAQGFNHLVAPVRPSLKSRYPLIPITEYIQWQHADGLPFDPWLRVYVRAGGHIIHPCPRAMTVRGSRQQWTTWTGLDFPGNGNYIIPHGLVPVSVHGTTGEYIEPGIWVVHRLP